MRRRILILLAAAVLAGFSLFALLAYAHGADRRALQGREGVWVLLATSAIPVDTTGAEIQSKRLVRQVLMPAATVPEGALSQIDDSLADLKLNAPLQPDQMLLRGQFGTVAAATPSASPTFPLPPNLLAVSVQLSMAPQVAGNVRNGDKVSVFLTYPKQETTGERQATRLLVPRVTVISVGERLAAAADVPGLVVSPSAGTATGEPTAVPSPSATTATLVRYVVTLAVTQEEAEKLINGYNAGWLHLGLLGPRASMDPSAPAVLSSQVPS